MLDLAYQLVGKKTEDNCNSDRLCWICLSLWEMSFNTIMSFDPWACIFSCLYSLISSMTFCSSYGFIHVSLCLIYLCLLSFYVTVNGIVFNIFLQIFHCYYLRIYVSGVLTMYSGTSVNTFITSNIIFLNALRFSLFKVVLYTNRPSFISSFTNFMLFIYSLD